MRGAHQAGLGKDLSLTAAVAIVPAVRNTGPIVSKSEQGTSCSCCTFSFL